MFSRAASDKTFFGKTFFSRGPATPSGEILFINQSCDCDHQLLHVGYQLLYDMRGILKWSQPTKREAQTSEAVSKVQSRNRDGFGRLEGHAYYALQSILCGVEISSLKAGLEFVYTC